MANSAVKLETEWAEAGEDESFNELHEAIAAGKTEVFKAENPGLSYGKLLKGYKVKFAGIPFKTRKTCELRLILHPRLSDWQGDQLSFLMILLNLVHELVTDRSGS